ncbi:MAG: hypothetical protein A2888_02720 [Chlamydiae bacterium RIFCSPLOWO2_01_FULL_28_7]|nr:MAG: hypothetical protein A2888_02720 [Chlamydiae bacterium RIFCSPLOWO2_01_FULL_28_7]
MKYLFFLIMPFIVFSNPQEDKYLQRINSHILLNDYESALDETLEGLKKNQNSKKLKLKFIECLAYNQDDINAIKYLNTYLKEFPDEIYNQNFLEEISWQILYKGAQSTQYQTRLTSAIGSYLTQDVRAVDVILNFLRDTNAVIRSVALQLASAYIDNPIKNEVEKLLINEKIWLVKLEVIKACGNMKITSVKKNLEEIISADNSTYEEKAFATNALISMSDKINKEDIEKLSKSKKANLRKLSCDLILSLNILNVKDILIDLLNDPISEVRIASLNALSIVYLDNLTKNETDQIIKKTLNDQDPSVAITSAYFAVLKTDPRGEKLLKKEIFSENIDKARFAASVLAHLKNYSLSLKEEILKKHNDPYVLVNIAIGLIGERKLLKESSVILHDFLQKHREKIMVETTKNTLFETLIPSYVKHIDQIPNYPESIDQMTRLNLFSMLSIVDFAKAKEALIGFLKQKGWGVTGFAAATLLKEGDEDSLEIVRDVIKDKDESIRIQAALVLASIGRDENVTKILIDAYKSSPRELKIQILESLGHIRSKESINFLIETLSEPYQILRVVAASSLIRSLNS